MSAAYLVQYGRAAYVGRFHGAITCARGDRVVVRGPRGLEIGTILCEPAERFASTPEADGELLRLASKEDDEAATRYESLAQDLLAAANDWATDTGMSLALVDSEVSLNGTTAVLHGVPWGECDASPMFAALSDRFGLAVRFLDLSRSPITQDPPDPSQAKCSKPGCGSGSGGCSSCGSGSGGCSTGSCSRGKVKSADELTAYFADLRQQMERSAAARTPLA